MSAALSNADIVERIREGDREFYGTLASQYRGQLKRLAQQFVSDPLDAEDAVQGAHVLALSHLDQYQGRSPFVQWMTSITRNAALTTRRRSRYLSDVELQDCYADPVPSPEESAISQDIRRIVGQALDRIPLAYAVVFRLREVAGLSTAETGACLGLTRSCVKARLLRARTMLRNAIEPQLEGRRLRPSLRGPVVHSDPGET